MCGRFTARYTWAEIKAFYELINDRPPSNLPPRYNVCPTDPVEVVLPASTGCHLENMRWGLIPGWWSKPLKEARLSTFNARAETVTTKPFFREAWKRQRRCIIPVSGYYEWQDTPSGKQPWYFTRRDGEIISTAALWDEWRDRATGETLRSCTMIITEPNDFLAEVHDRMPVILEKDQIDAWLSGALGTEALRPANDNVLQRWAVSRRVNSSKAPSEDETLAEKIMDVVE